MQQSIDLVIFDCDGVLVDSEIIGINLTLALLAEAGCHISFEEFSAHYSGLHWPELIALLEKNTGLVLPAEKMKSDFYQRFVTLVETQLVRIPGTLETIPQLDYPRCICSNSAADQLELMLTRVGLKSLFAPHIYSAVDLGPGRAKPQPDIFLHAAQKFDARPAHTLVVEDSVHGVAAAKAAGMYVVGFIGASHTYAEHRERLLAVGADVVIDDMTLLPQEVAAFAQRLTA